MSETWNDWVIQIDQINIRDNVLFIEKTLDNNKIVF